MDFYRQIVPQLLNPDKPEPKNTHDFKHEDHEEHEGHEEHEVKI